jgi:hypothetical protein
MMRTMEVIGPRGKINRSMALVVMDLLEGQRSLAYYDQLLVVSQGVTGTKMHTSSKTTRVEKYEQVRRIQYRLYWGVPQRPTSDAT